MSILLRDAAGVVEGGLVGISYYDWMIVEMLSVPERLCGHGVSGSSWRSDSRTARRRGGRSDADGWADADARGQAGRPASRRACRNQSGMPMRAIEAASTSAPPGSPAQSAAAPHRAGIAAPPM